MSRGGTGFVGANLARHLLEQGEEVFLLVRQESKLWRIEDLSDQFRLVTVDFSDADRLHQVVREIRPDVIYHLATYGAYTYRHGQPYQQDVNQMVQINIQGTINLIRAAATANVRKFINVGSSSEYGVKVHPMREEDVLMPTDVYGATKASSYLVGSNVAKQLQLPFIHVRLFSVYGAYEEKARLIPTVILQHLTNQSLMLANPQSVRDFIHIQDVVEGLEHFARVGSRNEPLVNLGTGIQSSVEDVVKHIRSISLQRPEILWGSMKTKPNEPTSWVADTTRMLASGFQPRHSLQTGLTSVYRWFEEHLDQYL